MKTTALALAALLIAASSAAAFFWQLQALREERQHEDAEIAERVLAARSAAARHASIEKKLEELSSKLEALEAEGRALRERSEPAAGLKPGVAVAGAEKAVPAASGPGAGGSEEPPAAGGAAKSEERLGEFLDELAARETSAARRRAIWSEIGEAGLLDRAVEEFEERAKESPRDPDRRSELGQAYLQKVFVSSDIQKGTWAAKADRAFDEALALNPAHWEARFQKATSLSYWPPIMGKQPEAVRQFEILLANQETAPVRPEFAQTYLFLGNLYQQRGDKEKAAETWRKGAEVFPQNRELAEKSAGEEGK